MVARRRDDVKGEVSLTRDDTPLGSDPQIETSVRIRISDHKTCTLSLFDQHFAVVVPQVRLAFRGSIRVGLNIHHASMLVLQVTPRAHITTFTAQRLVTFRTLTLRFIITMDAVFNLLIVVKRAFKGHRFEGESSVTWMTASVPGMTRFVGSGSRASG